MMITYTGNVGIYFAPIEKMRSGEVPMSTTIIVPAGAVMG